MSLPAAPPVASDTAPLLEIHRDVTTSGLRLRTTEWSVAPGDPRLEPIVALPGALAPRESFQALAIHLGRSSRLIAVDFPGFGESEKPPPQKYPYGPAAFAELMMDLFAGLALPRAHVLGHGLGGAVAIHLAARHPELVRRLALIAPVGAPGPRLRSQSLISPWIGGMFLGQLVGKQLFSSVYRERIYEGESPETLNAYYEAFSQPAARAALLATLRASLDRRPFIADSRRVRSPTLILWGRHDRLLPVERGRLLSREMPKAGVELLDAGHAPHVERPEAVGAILERFFRGQRAGSG